METTLVEEQSANVWDSIFSDSRCTLPREASGSAVRTSWIIFSPFRPLKQHLGAQSLSFRRKSCGISLFQAEIVDKSLAESQLDFQESIGGIEASTISVTCLWLAAVDAQRVTPQLDEEAVKHMEPVATTYLGGTGVSLTYIIKTKELLRSMLLFLWSVSSWGPNRSGEYLWRIKKKKVK